MSSGIATQTAQMEVAIRIIENNTSRLAEHLDFDKKIEIVLSHPEFAHLSTQHQVLTIEKLLREHREALKPLVTVNNALVGVLQGLSA